MTGIDLPLSPQTLLGLFWRAGRFGWGRRKLLQCYWHSIRYRKDTIRISCAQLIRVRYGNKFLLVPSERIAGQMQPPGGVAKAHSQGRSELEMFGAQPGDDYKYFDKDHDDLRIHVPASNLVRFLRWFESKKGREISPEREFQEELVDTEILPRSLFSRPTLSPLKTEIIGPRFSPHFKCMELLVHEIFALECSDQQNSYLKDLQTDTNCASNLQSTAGFGWFTSQEIEFRGRLPDADHQNWRIGDHAVWMLSPNQ